MNKCFLNIKQCKFPKLSNKINNYYTFKKINHRICKNCNLIFHYPINKSSYKKIYNKDYYQSNYTENSKLYHQRKLQYNLDKKELIQFYKDDHKKKILDYGCGNGEFILKFKSKKYGFEINENIKKKELKTCKKKTDKQNTHFRVKSNSILHKYNLKPKKKTKQ